MKMMDASLTQSTRLTINANASQNHLSNKYFPSQSENNYQPAIKKSVTFKKNREKIDQILK